jgi:hypothetical protein
LCNQNDTDVFIPISIQTERRGHHSTNPCVVSASKAVLPEKSVAATPRRFSPRWPPLAPRDPGSRHPRAVHRLRRYLQFGWSDVERKQAAIMSDRTGANASVCRIPYQFKLIWWGLTRLADGSDDA